ncbi:hypothetical protein K9M41_04120 [Candidatus Gracilibacteria bacterium]|nr:hypothetical protein [Candidatus Gracilibacteria bacterium]
MDNQFEKRLNTEIAAQSGGEALSEALSSTDKVSELVGESAGESISSVSNSKAGFSAISSKVRNLLFSKEQKLVSLPSFEVQQKKVRSSLEKETNDLIRQAKKIQKKRNFSANMLEEVVAQIRYLRKLLAELISFTADKLEHLYRQFVLKTA